MREEARGIRRSHHSAGSPPSAAVRHISSCRCGSSAPTRGEVVLAMRCRCITVGGEKLQVQTVSARKPFVAKEAQVRELDLRRRAQRAPSRLAGRAAYLSGGSSASASVPPRRPHAKCTGRPKSAPPSAPAHAIGRQHVRASSRRPSAHLRQQPDGCQTFVSPQTQLIPGNAGCSSNRCEGWLPVLTRPMHIIELASALQSRHLYPESPVWNSTVQRLLGLAMGRSRRDSSSQKRFY